MIVDLRTVARGRLRTRLSKECVLGLPSYARHRHGWIRPKGELGPAHGPDGNSRQGSKHHVGRQRIITLLTTTLEPRTDYSRLYKVYTPALIYASRSLNVSPISLEQRPRYPATSDQRPQLSATDVQLQRRAFPACPGRQLSGEQRPRWSFCTPSGLILLTRIAEPVLCLAHRSRHRLD